MSSAPANSPITKERASERDLRFHIPRRVDIGLILEGVYITGMAGILLPGYLRVRGQEGVDIVYALLGISALAGIWRLVRALWLSFSTRTLSLTVDEIIFERRWGGWKSSQRLPTSQIRRIEIKRSRWSGGKKTIHYLDFTTGYSSLWFGYDLTWEEKHWLSTESKAFLRPFAPELVEDDTL